MEKGKSGTSTSRKGLPRADVESAGDMKSKRRSKVTGGEAWPAKQDTHNLLEFEDAVKDTAETLRYEDNVHGFQQVDRVVGCRVHGDNMESGYNVMVNTDEKPTCEKPLDDCGGGNSAEYHYQDIDIANCSGTEVKVNKDNLQAYRRSSTEECNKESSFMDSMHEETEEGCHDDDTENALKDGQTHASDDNGSSKEVEKDARTNLSPKRKLICSPGLKVKHWR